MRCLTHMLQCDLEVGEFDLQAAMTTTTMPSMSRAPHPYPMLQIKCRPASIFDYQYEDFEGVEYQHHHQVPWRVRFAAEHLGAAVRRAGGDTMRWTLMGASRAGHAGGLRRWRRRGEPRTGAAHRGAGRGAVQRGERITVSMAASDAEDGALSRRA